MEETVTVVKKKSTGRRKIEIKKIQKRNNLQVTFSKRRRGLFKKAAELSVLCGADVAVLVQSPGGKVFAAGGRGSVDSIIDRYVAGKASSSSSYKDVINQIHCQQQEEEEEEEEKKYLDIMKEIEIEKAKGKLLIQDKGDDSKGFWWEQAVDNLELDELVEHMAAMEILRKNVLTRAEEMAANNNAADNNAIAAASANNNPGDNNAAANNNADFSSGILIPNVSLDSFGRLPVIHCESDNGDKAEHMAAMEILRKNVVARAEEMAANNNAADNNAIAAAAAAANNNPGDDNADNNNVAANNNADFSSGVLIPNVSLDSFGGLPVIHCESDNGDKVDGTHDPFMVENLNFETNSHQLLISGNPKLETDDELFMYDNPNSLIDNNQPLMLAIPRLEIDGDEPLMLENPKSPIDIDQLLVLENFNTQNNIDEPFLLENPNKQGCCRGFR